MLRVVVLRPAVQEAVRELLEALVAENAPPSMSNGITAHGAKALMASAAGTRMALFSREPLATAHTTGQLAVGSHAGHLLGVERQVVAQHARGLPRRDLGEDRHVVEQRGDVVDQGEQARCHGR